MRLFERNYKAAATTELERSIRELEERNKISENKVHFQKDMLDVQSNVNFAERIHLISMMQANIYRNRLQKAHSNFEHLERTETMTVVNDFENPRERSMRCQSIETYNAQIIQEKEKASIQQYGSHQRHAIQEERNTR